MKKLLFVLILATFSLGACNTIEGIGKDTAAMGDAITGTARDTKGY